MLSNSDTQFFITSNWGLSESRIQNGASSISFVNDPFSNLPAIGSSSNTSGPVLQVQCPTGSYENDDYSGAQLYTLWNPSGSTFQSMLLSYEVAFDFGLEGGKPSGRTSWGGRTNGAEGGLVHHLRVHAVVLIWRVQSICSCSANNNTCKDSGIQCNDESGISLNRGFFTFSGGQCMNYIHSSFHDY